MKQLRSIQQRLVFWPLVWMLGISQPAGAATTFKEWLDHTEGTSISHLFRNVSAPGTAAGSVLASPSKDNPNYYFHWVRDAAITMDVAVRMYATAKNPEVKAELMNRLLDYIRFSRRNQMTDNPSGGLGEPKFEVDGGPFYGDWGRPQNDGPAMRAATLTKLAFIWLKEGKESLVREYLYEQELPAHRVIKADLEYVSHHWRQTDFDLWEECRGHHFYTRMVQRRALQDGSRLAAFLGDAGAAGWYARQAKELESELHRHWDPSRGYIVTTLNRDGGIDYKHSNLDASVILAVLHGETGDGFFSANDPKILATAERLEATFREIYPINHKGLPGTLIGRYPEDRYDGIQTGSEGSAWVLLSAAFAELYYKAAFLSPSRAAAATWRAKGDAHLERLKIHGPDGSFAEQMNRRTGFMQGAPHLTWSYGAFLTSVWSRPKLQ